MSSISIPGLDKPLMIPGEGPGMNGLESALASVGLDTPLKRLGGIGAFSWLALTMTKPGMFYDGGGHARSWSLTSPEDPSSTPLPVWLAVFLAGAVPALFL